MMIRRNAEEPIDLRRFAIACAALMFMATGSLPGAEPIAFNRDIRPILSDTCFKCHGFDPNSREADLRLDIRDAAFAQRDGGAPVVPGRPDQSMVWQRISSEDPDTLMPPPDSHMKLTEAQKELFRRWIAEGAKYEEHWSLIAPKRPAIPAVKHAGWPRNDIDRFILARLEAEGLAPSPEADRATLIRRLSLDLTGLPPTPAEVNAFIADTSPRAYENLVDRLLASPRYGERMAWNWLDAARYADTNGYQGDNERTMWPWRDWVVEAFNENMPYDQFTVWQIAGDLLPGATTEQKLATAFNRNHMINGEGGRIAEENRVEYVFDQIETVATTWLGLTFNCCRCHDHKYDPIKQADYYSLFAFFNQTPVDGKGGNPRTPPVVDMITPEQEERIEKLRDEVSERSTELAALQRKLEKELAAKIGDEPSEEDKGLASALRTAKNKRNRPQREEVAAALIKHDEQFAKQNADLEKLRGRLTAVQNEVVKVMVMADMDEPRTTYILEKGIYNQPRGEVTADTPGSLPPMPDDAPRNRLGLARWLVSPEHPLTARVTVNRLWQQIFGTGIVKTPEDFGTQGQPPSHPALLDYLALEMMDRAWDIKAMIRLMVTSAAYRQSSRATPELIERDPENRLLARGPRFRLPSWMIRDQALAASGLLVDTFGGPGVNGYQPPGVWEEATFGKKEYEQDHGAALYRRSLYTFWRRIIGPTVFFDAASRQVCTVKQVRTNTPLHALTTLNDVTFVEAARALAQRVLLEGRGRDDAQRVAAAFRLVLAREPKAAEVSVLREGLARLRAQYAADPSAARELLNVGESKAAPAPRVNPVEHAAWTGLCLGILNLDEALTKE